jgi:ABC-type branched-subunit amino acid transport system substrate-binding protein
MKKGRWVAVAAVVALVTAGLGMSTAGAQSSGGGALQASEIGVTPTTIRIAVVADVNVPVDPGLFAGSVAGVQGFAKYINAHGGLAGRKLVVDFIDSQLSDTDAQNAVIKACTQDFALVGTSALFLNSVNNMQACKDQAGAMTGLPDIPVVTTEVVQQCNPESYPVNPPSIICSTQNAHPQTYQGNIGRAYYYQKKFGKLHGAFIYSSDLKSAHDASFSSGIGGVRSVGIKSDQDFSLSAMAPQSAYTTVIQTMKNDNSNYFGTGNAFNSMVLARKEATLQGLNSTVKVWDCTLQCYTPDLISQGGADVEGTFISLLFLPFAETSSNPMLANFVKYTAKANADGFAVQAWAAADLFADAIGKVAKADGNNGLTRKALFTQLDTEHSFSAGGLIGTTDVAGRKTSPCQVILQVKGGKFVRVFPTKAGTFDCSPKNYKTYKLDLSS